MKTHPFFKNLSSYQINKTKATKAFSWLIYDLVKEYGKENAIIGIEWFRLNFIFDIDKWFNYIKKNENKWIKQF